MIKKIKQVALLGLFLVTAPQALGSLITNGDFSNNCSFNGWEKDTDGNGDIGSSDFNISGSPPACTADVSIGDWSLTDASVNTLSQNLYFTGADNSSFLLSIDFSVDSFSTSNDASFFADVLSISLSDDPAFPILLLEADIDGYVEYNLEFILDSSYANDDFWTFDFIMADTFDGSGSTLSIENVSLTEILFSTTDVPEPSSLVLFALGFAGLSARRKYANELIRKSLFK